MADTLVNIALLVFFVGSLGMLVFEGQAFAVQQDRRSQMVRDREALVSILPALCLSVRPAPWAAPDTFVESAGGLSAGSWEGRKNERLTLTVHEGTLSVKCPQGLWVWKSLEGVKVEWWKNDGRTIGLVVRWSEASEPRAIALPWGSQAL